MTQLSRVLPSYTTDTYIYINSLYENLQFAMEREQKIAELAKSKLPVLDMRIIHDHQTGKLESIWYSKPTDLVFICGAWRQ